MAQMRKEKKRGKMKSQGQTLKRGASGPSKISAQTRTKLSQYARKRRRVKGRFVKGRTYAVKKSSGGPYKGKQGVPEDLGPSKGSRINVGGGEVGKREIISAELSNRSSNSNQQNMIDAARMSAERRLGTELTPADMEVSGPLKKTKMTEEQMARRISERGASDKGGQLYEPATRTGLNRRGEPRRKLKTVTEYMNNAPESRELIKMMDDPNSVFNRGLPQDKGTSRSKYSMGARRRLEKYSIARQQGAGINEALSQVAAAHQGRRPADQATVKGAYKAKTEGELQLKPREAGRKSPFETVTPRESDFSIGVDIPHVESLTNLKKRNPDMSEREVISLQERQREYLHDEFLKNQQWAHETRQASLLGNLKPNEGPNEVTVFTTTLGVPNVTVPTDSLLGQYVIRKRKRTLLDAKLAKRSDLKGEFPRAVRDQHVAEALTSRSFGAVGRSGMFKRGGWRVGKKFSRGFNQPMPVGAQIMYDRAGQPIYDEQGNIRFTQGATRPFEIGTKHGVGLGVYVG